MMRARGVRRSGITLVEVLLSVVILSGALIIIYQPLLTTLRAAQHVDVTLEAERLLDDHIWRMEDRIRMGGVLTDLPRNGLLIGQHQPFDYRFQAYPLDEAERLHRLDFDVTWSEGGLKKRLMRSIYLLQSPS